VRINANATNKSDSSIGHRQRLRRRFLAGGANAVADYELLELVLFLAQARGDVKPLAKALVVSRKWWKLDSGVISG